MPSMMVRMSEKSRLIRPGVVMMSLMPCTAWRRTSSAMRKASKKLVPFGNQAEQLIVGNGDDGIDHAGQLGQALFGLLAALGAFEAERLGDHGHGERAEFLGERSDHGRGSGAGAAAQAGGDEDHVRAFQQVDDALGIFERGLAAHRRIRAGAEPVA